MKTARQFICRVDEIDDPGSKAFTLTIGRKSQSIFVVHKDGGFFAYLNRCPHTGVNLEWQEDRFLDLDQALIQCATHDALFTIEDGECIAGPCLGERLQRLEIIVENDLVHLRP